MQIPEGRLQPTSTCVWPQVPGPRGALGGILAEGAGPQVHGHHHHLDRVRHCKGHIDPSISPKGDSGRWQAVTVPPTGPRQFVGWVPRSHGGCFDFGGQLGTMLATFSLKIRHRYLREEWFMMGLSSFSVFGASWPLLGALWARFGRVRASILEICGAHFH